MFDYGLQLKSDPRSSCTQPRCFNSLCYWRSRIYSSHNAWATNSEIRDQLAALLADLLRHAPAISHLQPDLHNVMHLIQLTVQALPCCKSNLQVQLEAKLAMYTQLCELNSPLHNSYRHNKQGVRCYALWGKQQKVLNSLRLIRCAGYRVRAGSCTLFKHSTHWP